MNGMNYLWIAEHVSQCLMLISFHDYSSGVNDHNDHVIVDPSC